jgi:hypothetical protein
MAHTVIALGEVPSLEQFPLVYIAATQYYGEFFSRVSMFCEGRTRIKLK